MHPILLKLGPFTLYSYGASLVMAFLIGTWLAARAARGLPPRQAALSPEQVVDLTCLSLLGGIVGARLFYLALYWEIFLRYPQEILALWHGGLVWYGGLGGAVVAGWCYVRAKGLDPFRVADHMAPFMAVGHAIGRLGCFLNGCCYGKPTSAWWGVELPKVGQRVIPTQLIEMGGLLVLYLILRRLQRSSPFARSGGVAGSYLGAYAILRFIIESLRGDQTVWRAGLTLQQAISLGVLLGGLWLLWRAAWEGNRRGTHVPVSGRTR